MAEESCDLIYQYHIQQQMLSQPDPSSTPRLCPSVWSALDWVVTLDKKGTTGVSGVSVGRGTPLLLVEICPEIISDEQKSAET